MKFSIPDMSCAHCVSSIKTAVAAMDPDAVVSADLEHHVIEVRTDRTDAEVIAVLNDIGFPATPAK